MASRSKTMKKSRNKTTPRKNAGTSKPGFVLLCTPRDGGGGKEIDRLFPPAVRQLAIEQYMEMQNKCEASFPNYDDDKPSDKRIKQILDNTHRDICKCGHRMEKDANFCSNCGLPRVETLRGNLTADEKMVLSYVIAQKAKFRERVYIVALLHIPFFDTIIERFEIALRGLAKKGHITFENGVAELKESAP